MTWITLALLLGLAQQKSPSRTPKPNDRDQEIQRLIGEISRSGRVLRPAAKPDQRVNPKLELAPGDPPLIAFRYFEGESKHRFGKLDLVMDDAGH